MANVTTYLAPATTCKSVDVGNFTITRSQAIPAAAANNGDAIQLLTIPHAMRLFDVAQAVSATLGAGATVQLRVNRGGAYTALVAASTAAAASNGRMTAPPMDLQAGDIIELLVGGANITAGATVTIDLMVFRK